MDDYLTQREKNIEERIRKYQYGDRLYHYTNNSSAYGIFGRKELWVGNTATMNDRLEVSDFINRLYEATKSDLHDLKKKQHVDAFFTQLKERLQDEYPYAMCFSSLYEDAAQWERYADNGTGLCICFNTKQLMKLFYGEMVFFDRVYYDYDIREHDHYRLLMDYFSFGTPPADWDDKGLQDNILACGYFHKHQSFQSESEIRITTFWDKIIRGSRIEYELVNNRIKRVLKLSLQDLCNQDKGIEMVDLFDSIILGPRSDQSVSEFAGFLFDNGFEELSGHIARSKCPLR